MRLSIFLALRGYGAAESKNNFIVMRVGRREIPISLSGLWVGEDLFQ
jgi:hypothetical protein